MAVSASAKNYLGFNSGATKDDNTAKFKADFVQEFTTAKNLQNAPGDFSAVRLYTNIQAYSQTSEPIEAFEAAIETGTNILLGVWASGTNTIQPEIKALKNAVDKFGTKFTDLVIGISIGSEDLYRDSATGQANKAGVGASPNTILKFINDYKTGLAGTPLASKPVGHVDTWDVWPNSTVKAVMDAVDFIGVNEFPYYEKTNDNTIQRSGQLFDRAYDAVLAVAGNKPVWVTETGWPYTDASPKGEWGQAVASVDNAQYYWQEIGCRRLFGKTTAFWYNIRDSNAENKMKFAITDKLATKPRFDLTCPTTFKTPNATQASSSTTSAGFSTSTSAGSSPSKTATQGSATVPTSATGASASPATSTPASAATSFKQSSSMIYALSVVFAGALYFL